MSRRRFLTLVGSVSAATGLAPSVVAHALLESPTASAALTTLARTLRAGNVLREGTATAYRAVTDGPGEPHLLRTDLADPASPRTGPRRSLVHFIHLTDQHVTDAQSPLRLPFVRGLERLCTTSDLPAKSAHRHHELAGVHIMDAMNAQARAISFSPVTGTPLQAAITTGDNIDNAQANELELHIGVMNGGRIDPDSGGDGYEGVQRSGDLDYWHPDSDVGDVMKVAHGFPVLPSFIDSTLEPFDAVGIGVPWFTCYGNHDALVQGNFPLDRRGLLDDQLVSSRLLTGFPDLPDGTDTCSLLGLMGGVAREGGIRTLIDEAPFMEVTADPARTFADRRDWVQAHLRSSGLPNGHGLTADNLGETEASSRLYYTTEVGDTRWIVLDTTNPGGLSNGSVGQIQLDWLEAELTRADQDEKLVLLFSHHGLRSLDNPINVRVLLGDDYDAVTVDPQRRLAAQVEAVIERHPCVIAWFNGHSHTNTVVARETFWDIGTAAHIDWPGQSRLAEVIDNGDGTLSIVTTIIDHAGDGDHALAGQARELMMNDPLGGWHSSSGDRGAGTGRETDRNVELLIEHPFPGTTDPDEPPLGATERASSRRVSPPLATSGLGAGPFGAKLSIAGALTAGALVGATRLRGRAPEGERRGAST